MGEYTTRGWKLVDLSLTPPSSHEQSSESQEVEYARYTAWSAQLQPSGTRAKILP